MSMLVFGKYDRLRSYWHLSASDTKRFGRVGLAATNNRT